MPHIIIINMLQIINSLFLATAEGKMEEAEQEDDDDVDPLLVFRKKKKNRRRPRMIIPFPGGHWTSRFVDSSRAFQVCIEILKLCRYQRALPSNCFCL